MKKAVLVATIVLAGCGPKIRPTYQAAVDSVLSKHVAQSKSYDAPAPSALKPMPWKVGQWALYRVTNKKGEIGFEKMSVVAQDDCGVWLEMVRQDPRSRSIAKVCYEKVPEVSNDPSATVQSALDAMKKIVTKADDGPVQTIDLRAPEGSMMKMMMGKNFASMVQWNVDPNSPRADITVPAGTFKQTLETKTTVKIAFITVTGTSWVHPSVPVSETVKSVTSDGTTMELVDFGSTGATSELAESAAGSGS